MVVNIIFRYNCIIISTTNDLKKLNKFFGSIDFFDFLQVFNDIIYLIATSTFCYIIIFLLII